MAHVRQCGGVPGSRVCDRTQVRSRNCGILVAAGVKNHFKQCSPYIVVHLLAPPASSGLVLQFKTGPGRFDPHDEPVGLANRQLVRFTRWWTDVQNWDHDSIPIGLFDRRNQRIAGRNIPPQLTIASSALEDDLLGNDDELLDIAPVR